MGEKVDLGGLAGPIIAGVEHQWSYGASLPLLVNTGTYLS